MSQAANSKGRENVSKQKTYASLNLNQTFVGSKAETKVQSGSQRHGMQTLGKVNQTRRPPPPANLPSLKKENLGNDPSVNLVPSGKSGWGKKEKEAKQSQEQQQQASPSIQTPAKTSQPEEVSLRPNAGAVPKPGESKKSWSSTTKPSVASSASSGSTPPPSTYFQREFPSLGADGGPGKPQSAEGVAVEGIHGSAEGAARHGYPPEEQFHPADRDSKHIFNGNTAQQQRQHQFYPQQPYREHFAHPAMYPVNRGMAPGFHPMHPPPYPFPMSAGQKDQMHQFEQHYMRMPMHGTQPPFPPSDAGDQSTQTKKPVARAQETSSGGRLDWADTQEEVDYNAKLKFDESDGEPSPPSSPKPKSSKNGKSSRKEGKPHKGEPEEEAKQQPPSANDKETGSPGNTAKQTGDQVPPTREAWAEMFRGYQGPMQMPYPAKWGMGFMPPYDPRQPMQMQNPYHQYPPQNWFFVPQPQMRMNHPNAPTGEQPEGSGSPRPRSRDKSDSSASQELWEDDKKAEGQPKSTPTPPLQESDNRAQNRGKFVQEHTDGHGATHEPPEKERDHSKSQHRSQEQSYSKSSSEVPPRFRYKNQQRQSPSLEHTTKGSPGEDGPQRLSEKLSGGNTDGSVRRIIKRRDSSRSEDSVSMHSLDGTDKPTVAAKEKPQGEEAASRGHRNQHAKSGAKSDQKEPHAKNTSDQSSRKSSNRNEKTASSQGKSTAKSSAGYDKQEKSKSSKSKSIKDGMKKLEKTKSKPNGLAKPAGASKATSEAEPGRSTTATRESKPVAEHGKSAWASVVTGEPSEIVNGATQVETSKQSLLDIQKEQELKDSDKVAAPHQGVKATGEWQAKQESRNQEGNYERQPHRNREKYDSYDRRHQDDRKRKYNESESRINDHSRSHGNRKEHSRFDNDRRPDQENRQPYQPRGRGRNFEEDRRGDNRRSYRSHKPGTRDGVDNTRRGTEPQSESGTAATGESVPASIVDKGAVNKPGKEVEEKPVTSAKHEKTAEVNSAVAADERKATPSSERRQEDATHKDGALAKGDGGHSTRRKESEKYSAKYHRNDEKKRSRTGDRPSHRSNDRRREGEERHPDRPLFSSRGRGQSRGSTRDSTRSKSAQPGRQEEPKSHAGHTANNEKGAGIPEGNTNVVAAEDTHNDIFNGKEVKETSWGKMCDSDGETFESCSDNDETTTKATSKSPSHTSSRGSGNLHKAGGYDHKHDGATAPRFRKNDGVSGRGRGRFAARRGGGQVGGKPGHPPRSMGRGRSPRDSRNNYGGEHSTASPSHKAGHDESSDNSTEYHSAGETAEAGDDESKSSTKRNESDRPGHSGRGAKRVSRGRGTKAGHFLGHRQQAGGRPGDSSVLVDVSPAADNQQSNTEVKSNDNKSVKDHKDDKQGNTERTSPVLSGSDPNANGSDPKKGTRASKQPTPKVDLFSTFDVRDIAGVVCIDDRPQDDDSQFLSKGTDDDDGFVQVTYKRGNQKDQREKAKKETRKRSRDDNQKSAKSAKPEQKSASTKAVKPAKTSPDSTARVSPVSQVGLTSATSPVPPVTSSQSSNAAMAAVGEWEPARSLMRSTSITGNTQSAVDQPQVPAHPVSPPPGNAWQRPLTITLNSTPANQHTPDPKAVGSGKPKPQQQQQSSITQSVTEPMVQAFEQPIVADVQAVQEAASEAMADQTSAPPSKRKPISRSSGKEKSDRPKREGKSTSARQMSQKRDAKKTLNRRSTGEKAPRFLTNNRSKGKKDSAHPRATSGKDGQIPNTDNEIHVLKHQDGKVSVRSSSFTEASSMQSSNKPVDSSFREVPLHVADEAPSRAANSLPSPSKLVNRPFSDEDAQNAKDTARSVIKSLGDDDERNLETKSLPGSPPLAVEIPEPALSGPSSDPGHKGSPGPRSMVHEFTEMSMKLLATNIKDMWNDPINDNRTGRVIGSQVTTSSWSEASHSTEPTGTTAAASQISAEQEVIHQGESNDVLNGTSNNKRDEGMPLQRSQDVFNAKRVSNDAQNVCKVKPRQQQSENDNKQTAVYSTTQLMQSQHHDAHQTLPSFQAAPGQKGHPIVSQFVVTSDHRRATQVVPPTLMHSEREYNEAMHHQSIGLQQVVSSGNRMHPTSSSSPLSQSSQDVLQQQQQQQRIMLNSVYGQPGISVQQNQMLAPWHVLQSQVPTGSAGSFRSQIHHNNPIFNASPVSLPNSGVYMTFDPQVGSSTAVLPSQGGSSQLQHQPVGIMLPRNVAGHQGNPQAGPYVGVQGQQYPVRPHLIGGVPEMSQSDNSALINHVNAKPFKPQSGPAMSTSSVVPQQIIHNQLVASVRPRPLSARSIPAGSSPPMPLHEQARMGSPPMDPSIQFVAAGMPMKGHHILPPNSQLQQHIGGQLPPQLFRQQQPGAGFVQRGLTGAVQPRYQRPVPGPIQRPGSGAVPLSTQVIGPNRPRQGLPFQAVPSIPANVLPAQNPLYNKTQLQQNIPVPPGGFRDQQHQKMIADTQRFFEHTEPPVPRRGTLSDRATHIVTEINPSDESPGKVIAPTLLPVGSGQISGGESQLQPHSQDILDVALNSSKEQQSSGKIEDAELVTSIISPAESKTSVPVNMAASEL